jgi:DNA (cytosine-5)-methyltransferase 1
MGPRTRGRAFEDVEANSLDQSLPHKLPSIVSLFCGAGGLDLGFADAGFEIGFAADNMAAAIETHKRNFPDTTAEVIDLATTCPNTVVERIKAAIQPGTTIGVIGGPPCQGFSRSNPQSVANDPRNKLITHYCDIIFKLQTVFTVSFFVFENVLGIKDKKHAELYSNFLSVLEAHGFTIFEKIVHAVDYGVPQTRKRVIVLGSSDGLNLLSLLDKGTRAAPCRTVRSALENLDEPIFFEHGLDASAFPKHVNHWTMKPRSKKFTADQPTATGRSFRRLRWDAPSPTIAMGHREIPVHPDGKRRISIYEAMKLQGFPDTFEISGTLSAQVVQVSNAVPPPLALAVATSIKFHLEQSGTVCREDN